MDKCPKCGTEVSAECCFCPVCGAIMSESSARPPPLLQPAPSTAKPRSRPTLLLTPTELPAALPVPAAQTPAPGAPPPPTGFRSLAPPVPPVAQLPLPTPFPLAPSPILQPAAPEEPILLTVPPAEPVLLTNVRRRGRPTGPMTLELRKRLREPAGPEAQPASPGVLPGDQDRESSWYAIGEQRVERLAREDADREFERMRRSRKFAYMILVVIILVILAVMLFQPQIAGSLFGDVFKRGAVVPSEAKKAKAPDAGVTSLDGDPALLSSKMPAAEVAPDAGPPTLDQGIEERPARRSAGKASKKKKRERTPPEDTVW